MQTIIYLIFSICAIFLFLMCGVIFFNSFKQKKRTWIDIIILFSATATSIALLGFGIANFINFIGSMVEVF